MVDDQIPDLHNTQTAQLASQHTDQLTAPNLTDTPKQGSLTDTNDTNTNRLLELETQYRNLSLKFANINKFVNIS